MPEDLNMLLQGRPPQTQDPAQAVAPLPTLPRLPTLRDLVGPLPTLPRLPTLRDLVSQDRQRELNRRQRWELAELRDRRREGLSPMEAVRALWLIQEEARDEMGAGSPVERQEVVAKRHGFDLDELHSIATDTTARIRTRAGK